MSGANYAAWSFDPAGFDRASDDGERMRFLTNYAVLAPSGHNTQPWRFRMDDHTLVIEEEPSRVLSVSGKLAAEPHISLGSCAETLILGGRAHGCVVEVEYSWEPAPRAAVRLAGATTAEPAIGEGVRHRVSNRALYSEAPLPGVLVEQLRDLAVGDARLHLLTDRSDIELVADLTAEATRRLMGEPSFRLELSEWVRSNVTRQCDGMPGFTQGMPTPPSLIARHVIRRIDVSKGQADKDSQRVRRSSALGVIVKTGSDEQAMFDAGRVYARSCVLAETCGIATSGIAAAVLDSSARDRLTERLVLSDQPIALLRLGRAASGARHTPRHLSRCSMS